MIKLSELEFVFENLGSISNLTAEEFGKLEECVCRLYGCKGADVDFARYQLFMKKQATPKKVVDLSLLPPCSRC